MARSSAFGRRAGGLGQRVICPGSGAVFKERATELTRLERLTAIGIKRFEELLEGEREQSQPCRGVRA